MSDIYAELEKLSKRGLFVSAKQPRKIELLTPMIADNLVEKFDHLPGAVTILQTPPREGHADGQIAIKGDYIFCDPCVLITGDSDWDNFCDIMTNRTQSKLSIDWHHAGSVLINKTLTLDFQSTGGDGTFNGVDVNSGTVCMARLREAEQIFPEILGDFTASRQTTEELKGLNAIGFYEPGQTLLFRKRDDGTLQMLVTVGEESAEDRVSADLAISPKQRSELLAWLQK
jgi:hypothetical protein